MQCGTGIYYAACLCSGNPVWGRLGVSGSGGQACLIEGAGKDVQRLLLLYELRRDAVKEAPRSLVVRRPVLCKVLYTAA